MNLNWLKNFEAVQRLAAKCNKLIFLKIDTTYMNIRAKTHAAPWISWHHIASTFLLESLLLHVKTKLTHASTCDARENMGASGPWDDSTRVSRKN